MTDNGNKYSQSIILTSFHLHPNNFTRILDEYSHKTVIGTNQVNESMVKLKLS